MHFKRLPAWAQIICLLAVAFVITWGLWMALRDTLCAIDTKDWLLKRPTRGACFEFWLNRYQTSIAALVGLGAALYVVRPVFRQLDIMTRQAAIELRSVASERLSGAEQELAELNIAKSRVNSILMDGLAVNWNHPRMQHHVSVSMGLTQHAEALNKIIERLNGFSLADANDDIKANKRSEIQKALSEFESNTTQLSFCLSEAFTLGEIRGGWELQNHFNLTGSQALDLLTEFLPQIESDRVRYAKSVALLEYEATSGR